MSVQPNRTSADLISPKKARGKAFFPLPLLILLLFCTNTLLLQSTNTMLHMKAVQRHFQKGEKLFLKGNLPEAERELKLALSFDRGHSRCHLYLAGIYYKQGQNERALHHMESAETNYPRDSDRRHTEQMARLVQLKDLIAKLQLNLSEFEETCRGRRPESIEIENLIKAKETMKNQLEFQLSRDTDQMPIPPSEYGFLHGNILMRLKRYREAKSQFLKALETDPCNGDLSTNLIYCEYLLDERLEAKKHLNVARSLKLSLKPSLIDLIDKGWRQKMGIDSRGVAEFPPLPETTGNAPSANIYLVSDEQSRQALLIDPGRRDPNLEEYIHSRSLRIIGILNTHGHRDHTAANRLYSQRFQAPVFISAADGILLDKQNSSTSKMHYIEEERLDLGPFSVHILSVPGHTPGSVAYLINGHLFSGDSLFHETIDNIEAARALLALPPETTVFPGHGDPTTIGYEKALSEGRKEFNSGSG